MEGLNGIFKALLLERKILGEKISRLGAEDSVPLLGVAAFSSVGPV